MKSFMYYNPTKLLFGKGQLQQLAKEVAIHGKRVLLVYGGGSIKRNGIYADVVEKLTGANIKVFELPNVEPNPRLSTVRKGISICKEENIDFVLAVGGGSVIDCTKAIVAGAKTDVDVWDIITRKVKATSGLPYGSVVTIAGTGAEMSLSAVITKWDTKEKRAWASQFLRAKFTIVDPAFMVSVPKEQTVNGAIDAMSHVMEHYFNKAGNTPIQDEMCEGILRTIVETVPKLLQNLDDYEHRETIALASTLALSDQLNMGFVGDWGTHHIDHALSAVHDISHGGGMAILFPHWMKYVLDIQNVERFKRFAVKVLQIKESEKTDMQIAEEGISSLARIWASWGAPVALSDYEITADTLPLVAEKTISTQPNCGNFRKLSEKDILAILTASL